MSVRVSDFTMTTEMPKPMAPASMIDARDRGCCARTHDDQHADEAEQDGGDLARSRARRGKHRKQRAQIGVVNSIEISAAPSGIMVSA